MKAFLSLPILCILLIGSAAAHEPADVVLENEDLRVRISPVGAELQSLVAKETGRDFLWQGDPAYWADRAPIMFPCCVRFKDDRFTVDDQYYVLPKMGLAIYRDFEIVPTDRADTAVFELTAGKDTLRQYPFAFRLRVAFRLVDNRLVQRFTVANEDEREMPFALGGHPGFAFPITDTSGRADFEYWFSRPLTTTRREITDSLIQTRVVPFLDEESTLGFGDARVPDGGILLMNSPARVIGLARHGQPPLVTVDLGDFPNANLWSPPGFPFACIEPMVGHHDWQESPAALSEKDYLVRLAPGDEKTYRFTITVYPDR